MWLMLIRRSFLAGVLPLVGSKLRFTKLRTEGIIGDKKNICWRYCHQPILGNFLISSRIISFSFGKLPAGRDL